MSRPSRQALAWLFALGLLLALSLASLMVGAGDMHFESYFYASVRFGVPEERAAVRDPNRAHYQELQPVDTGALSAALRRCYHR